MMDMVPVKALTDEEIAVLEGQEDRIMKMLAQIDRFMLKIKVIKNGVQFPDLHLGHVYNECIRKEFDIKDDEVIIATIGRLVPVKNHFVFLEAAKCVLDKVLNAKFFIIGDGVLFNQLKNRTRELDIEEKVIFMGWRNDIKKLLSAIDIYVICSLVEGLNISVLEAMAAAKPVIGTSVKGISEIVLHNKTGILVPLNHTESLTKAILKLIDDKRLSTRMGLKGRQLIQERYSAQEMAETTLELYEKLC